MKKVTNSIINIFLLGVIVGICLIATTITLTQRIDDYRNQYKHGISVTVVKQEIPVVSLVSGTVNELQVQLGQGVKKGDVVATISNPLLTSQIYAFQSVKDNVSAQTEARIERAKVPFQTIKSPVDGSLGEILVKKGAAVNELTDVATIYANDNTRLLSYLSTNNYLLVKKQSIVKAYNPRLNLDILLRPDTLQPKEVAVGQFGEKKFGLYFTLVNPSDAISLLQNEDMVLQIDTPQDKVVKPIDFIVNFWNSILHLDQMTQQV